MIRFASIRHLRPALPGAQALRRAATAGAALLLAAGLGACNPVDTWRSITGISRNDPDPDTTPNTQNLAKAEGQPYPNLAGVPAPPVPTMTAAERDKLAKSLVADRANARYNGETLQPGFPANATVPPPPPPPPPAPKPAATPPPSPAAAAAPPAPAEPVKPPPAEPATPPPAAAGTPPAAEPANPPPAAGPAAAAPQK